MKSESKTAFFLGTEPPENFPIFARERFALDAREIEELLESWPEAPRELEEETAVREALNRAVWDLLETIAWARIAACREGSARAVLESLTQKEKIFLDFALVGPPLSEGTWEELDGALGLQQRSGPVTVELLHDWLGDCAARIFRFRETRSVREQIATAQKDLTRAELEVSRIRDRCKEIIERLEDADRVAAFQQKIDRTAARLATLASSPGDPGERNRLRERRRLTATWHRLRNEQAMLIGAYAQRRALSEAQNAYLTALTEVKRIKWRLKELKAQLGAVAKQNDVRAPEGFFPAVQREFDTIRSVLRQASRLDRMALPPVYLKGRPSWVPETVYQSVSEVLAVDKRMAQAWSNHKWEPPRLLLVPGQAAGVLYDKPANTVWLPVVTHEQACCSLLRALGLYRFAQAEKEQASFGSLSAYKEIREKRDLAEAFSAAYETYLTREVKGFRKLPTDVAKWFRLHLMQSA